MLSAKNRHTNLPSSLYPLLELQNPHTPLPWEIVYNYKLYSLFLLEHEALLRVDLRQCPLKAPFSSHAAREAPRSWELEAAARSSLRAVRHFPVSVCPTAALHRAEVVARGVGSPLVPATGDDLTTRGCGGLPRWPSRKPVRGWARSRE